MEENGKSYPIADFELECVAIPHAEFQEVETIEGANLERHGQQVTDKRVIWTRAEVDKEDKVALGRMDALCRLGKKISSWSAPGGVRCMVKMAGGS